MACGAHCQNASSSASLLGHLPPFVRAIARSFGRRLGTRQRTLTRARVRTDVSRNWHWREHSSAACRWSELAGLVTACSEEKGYLGNCILQPEPSGRVGFLIISLLIAPTRRRHAELIKRPVARRPRVRILIRHRTAVAFHSSASYSDRTDLGRRSRQAVMHPIGGPEVSFDRTELVTRS